MADERQLGSSYRLQGLLGEGASGRVYAGVDRGGRRYAIKVLRDDLARDPGIVNRFVQERTLLASIRHPNVVQVHDLVVEGGTLAIVMDLVEGSDLRSLLRERGPIPPGGIATWGRQIALALDAAHARGIIHRDVKPENVLVDAAGEARLTDFGIAKLVDGSRTTMMLGTPQYMAPEIAENREPTPASDLYSLGAALYELACGVPPFAGRGSAMATLRAHAYDLPGRPDGLPDDLWALIDALLAKDPRERPGSGRLVAEALERGGPGWAQLPAAPLLTSPPPSRGSATPPPAGSGADTVIAAAAAPGVATSDTVFADRVSPTPWTNPAGGSGPSPAPGGYPGSGTPYPPYGPYPSGQGSGPYPPYGAYPGGQGSGPYPPYGPPPGRPPERTNARTRAILIGAAAVVGALLLGGGVVLANPDLLRSEADPAPPTPSPTATTPVTVTTTVAPPAPTASAPQETVTVTTTTDAGDLQARLDEADGLVMGYTDTYRAGALTRSGMADYWTPNVQWYSAYRTREQVYDKLPDPAANRRIYDRPVYQGFRPGDSADEVDYLVRYDKRSERGQVIVTYTVVPSAEGRRITAVRERPA